MLKMAIPGQWDPLKARPDKTPESSICILDLSQVNSTPAIKSPTQSPLKSAFKFPTKSPIGGFNDKNGQPVEVIDLTGSSPASPSSSANVTEIPGGGPDPSTASEVGSENNLEGMDVDQEADEEVDEEGEGEGEVANGTPSKKVKKQWIRRDRAAQALRRNDRERIKSGEARAKVLWAWVASSGDIPSDKSRLIINETKEDNQGPDLLQRLHWRAHQDHQIDGVRFMWNRAVLPVTARQGCLLAHTMGLGKTMQIITLLVAIAEAAASDDPSISQQIPEDLRKSKTLVLCPSSLVDNWGTELRFWTSQTSPADALGPFYKLQSDVSPAGRISMVQKWAEEGGIWSVVTTCSGF